MEFINNWLRSLPDDGRSLYGLAGGIGIGLMILVVVCYLIRMKVKPLDALKGVIIAAIAYYFCIYAHRFLLWYQVDFDINRYFDSTANLAVGFTLLPFVAWLCSKTFNVSQGFSGDITALALLGFHVIGRSGCVFTGCCYGFPCSWGLFSHQTDTNHFPVCIVESLFTLGILIYLFVRICRKGYVPDGKNLPYMLLLYGGLRFISEFTRESTYQQWLFWRFSDVHIHMLLMVLVGALTLYLNLRRTKAVEVGEEPLPELKAQRR